MAEEATLEESLAESISQPTYTAPERHAQHPEAVLHQYETGGSVNNYFEERRDNLRGKLSKLGVTIGALAGLGALIFATHGLGAIAPLKGLLALAVHHIPFLHLGSNPGHVPTPDSFGMAAGGMRSKKG